MKKNDLVAVYGTLMSGFGNHRILSNSNFLGNDTINGFNMHDIGWFPGIIKGEDKISAEIYQIDSEETVQQLDYLEGYPNLYTREQVDTQYGKAWIYIYNNKLDDKKRVTRGDWREYTSRTKD